MPRHHFIRPFAITLAALSLASQANSEAHHHQQAHVHGEAELQVAIENTTVDLIFRSPAANLLGVEHRPRNDKQEQALKATRDWLETEAMIQTPDGDCSVVASSVQYQHERADEHEHGQGDKHHSDFEVTQVLDCTSPMPRTLVTPLMKRFPGIEHLSVEWLGKDGQGHVELQAGQDEIHLDH